MDNQDKQAIDGLFQRLQSAERDAPPRDGEAERFIQDRISSQPGAPYYMAQTIVMQEYALEQAQARITQLESQSASRQQGGGLFGGLFGGGGGGRPQQSQSYQQQPMSNPAVAQAAQQPGRGGGFLAGAAQTAMGVAGGVLLGNAVMGMFGGNEAQAAEAPAGAEPAEDAGAADTGGEEGGIFDGFFGGDDGGGDF